MQTPAEFLPKLRDHVEKLLEAYSTGPFSQVSKAKHELQVFLDTVVPEELPVLGEAARGKAETIADKVHLVPGVGMRHQQYSFEINRCRSVLIDIEKALTHLAPSSSGTNTAHETTRRIRVDLSVRRAWCGERELEGLQLRSLIVR